MTRTLSGEDADLAVRQARMAHNIRSLRRRRFPSRAAFHAATAAGTRGPRHMERLEDPASGTDHGLATLVAAAEALHVSTRCLIAPYFGREWPERPFRAPAPGGPAALGGEMRRLRYARRLTSAAAGQRAGIHPNYLTTLERGGIRSPGLTTIVRAAAPLVATDAMLARLVERLVAVYAGEFAPPVPPAPRRQRRDAVAPDGLPTVT